MRSVAVFVKGPGAGRESALRALQTAGFKVTLHPRRHAHPAQRLPPAQAAPGLRSSRRWLATSVRSASSAVARASSSTSRASAATPRSARITRRPYPPGQHGQGRIKLQRVRGAPSRETKGAARLRRPRAPVPRLLHRGASRRKGRTGEEMLGLLERRLDNAVHRMGFAASRSEARQLVRHGHVQVNGKRLDIPSYVLRVGDTITLEEVARKFKFVAAALARRRQASHQLVARGRPRQLRRRSSRARPCVRTSTSRRSASSSSSSTTRGRQRVPVAPIAPDV